MFLLFPLFSGFMTLLMIPVSLKVTGLFDGFTVFTLKKALLCIEAENQTSHMLTVPHFQ